MHRQRGVSPQHVHKYQSCPGCSSRTALPRFPIHIPTALMHTLRPDGRQKSTRHRATQIIVSLLGRLSKVCSTLTRAAARRSRPSHRPSTIRRRSTQSGIDAAAILCHHLLHRASASLSINQLILASCWSVVTHPQLLLAAAYEHQTQRNNPIVVSSVLTQRPGVGQLFGHRLP